MIDKPLGHKAYGSIPHLRGSRLGPGDYTVHEGQQRICTEKARDDKDIIVVQEKLDGSNVSVAKLDDGQLVALGRAGWLATSSKYPQHHLFAWWVALNYRRFDRLLERGERVVGEWLAQAHGTRYNLKHEPFVAFDIMQGHERATWRDATVRLSAYDFWTPSLLHMGKPVSIKDAIARLDSHNHNAFDPIEGCVWRVEREGKVDFLAKYVRPDKIDGCYLESITGRPSVWNEGLGDYIDMKYPPEAWRSLALAEWAKQPLPAAAAGTGQVP
jgi:hypothetical protein